MIIGPGFVIGTPPKTGMWSMEQFAARVDGMEKHQTHTMTVPDECKSYDRIMLVRDPYTRLISIWLFIRRSKNASWHKQTEGMTFDEFLPWFLDERQRMMIDESATPDRAPGNWTLTCTEFWKHLMAGATRSVRDTAMEWKQEDGYDSLASYLVETYAIDNVAVPHVNRSHETRRGEEYDIQAWYKPKVRERIWQDWSGEDCIRFGYDGLR